MAIDGIFSTTTQPLLEKVAAFTERRQDVLAGNLANISTPGYQTRDLPVDRFQAALRDAVSTRMVSPATVPGADAASPRNPSLGLWSWNAGTEPSAKDPFTKELFQAVEGKSAAVRFQDGANRSIETEIMEMTKNSMMQTMAVELMTAQFNKLQAVISERA